MNYLVKETGKIVTFPLVCVWTRVREDGGGWGGRGARKREDGEDEKGGEGDGEDKEEKVVKEEAGKSERENRK